MKEKSRAKANVLLIGSEEEENLSIGYLGATLEREGHCVKIVPCSKREDFSKVIKSVEKFEPDLIGFPQDF